MILNKSEDLKQAGFDSSLLGFDDTEKDGVDKTALDRFIDSVLLSANRRLQSWVISIGETSEFKQAELYLAIVQLLPYIWAKNFLGPTAIDIEGIKMSLTKVSEEEKKQTIRDLLLAAENSVSYYMNRSDSAEVVSLD